MVGGEVTETRKEELGWDSLDVLVLIEAVETNLRVQDPPILVDPKGMYAKLTSVEHATR